MFRSLKIRSYILSVEGVVILGLGLVFLYIRGDLTGGLFDIADIWVAVALTVVAMVLSALADWIGSVGEVVESFRRFSFYLFAALGVLLGVAVVVYSHYQTMALLLLFAAAHGLVFSISVFSFYAGHHHRAHHRGILYVAGAISLVFAVAMALFATRDDNQLGTGVLGAYLCFVGIRMLHHAWRLHAAIVRNEEIVERHKAAHAE